VILRLRRWAAAVHEHGCPPVGVRRQGGWTQGGVAVDGAPVHGRLRCEHRVGELEQRGGSS
jgi:hypothetical protein